MPGKPKRLLKRTNSKSMRKSNSKKRNSRKSKSRKSKALVGVISGPEINIGKALKTAHIQLKKRTISEVNTKINININKPNATGVMELHNSDLWIKKLRGESIKDTRYIYYTKITEYNLEKHGVAELDFIKDIKERVSNYKNYISIPSKLKYNIDTDEKWLIETQPINATDNKYLFTLSPV